MPQVNIIQQRIYTNSFCIHLKSKKQPASFLLTLRREDRRYQPQMFHVPTLFLNRRKVIVLPTTGSRRQQRIKNVLQKILPNTRVQCIGMQYVNAAWVTTILHGKALSNT